MITPIEVESVSDKYDSRVVLLKLGWIAEFTSRPRTFTDLCSRFSERCFDCRQVLATWPNQPQLWHYLPQARHSESRLRCPYRPQLEQR